MSKCCGPPAQRGQKSIFSMSLVTDGCAQHYPLEICRHPSLRMVYVAVTECSRMGTLGRVQAWLEVYTLSIASHRWLVKTGHFINKRGLFGSLFWR